VLASSVILFPRIFATNFYAANSLNIGNGNGLVNAVFAVPWIDQMYLRRVRTVTDENLPPPATHPLLPKWERRADELAPQIAPDAAQVMPGSLEGARLWIRWPGGRVTTVDVSLNAAAVAVDFAGGVRRLR
jgi:hypothetical protein